MSRAILEVKDVWVGDGPGAAVQGVSFSVGPGEVIGILGAPEAGKSRLLRCIGLDYPPTRGAVFLRGEQVSGASPERRRQLRSGAIELVHPPAPAGVRDETIPVRPSGVLLAAPRTCTVPVAGMRQRIQVAKALSSPADVLLLDEPFAGVDVAVRNRINELLGRLRSEVGTAIVVASRDAEVLSAVADTVLVLDEGVLVEQGITAQIFAAPSHPRTVALVEERRSA